MDFNQYLLAFRARRKAFMMVFAAVVIAALAVVAVLPRKYVASATVLLDAPDEQSLVARLTARERQTYTQTQVDLIQSGKVARRVLRDLKYTQLPGVREAYERDAGGLGTIEDWAAAELLRKLKVDFSGSSVVTLIYTESEPKLAAEVANAFAKAYVDVSLEMRTEPSREAAAWFEDQLKGLRTNVSQAQQKLTGYQKDKGIIYTDERTDVEAVRLADLSTALMAARNATYDSQTRYKQAMEFLSGTSATGASQAASADSLSEVMSNGSVMAVKAALVAAEARLEQSGADLGPNHPAYQRNVSEVQGLREKLSSEMKKVVAGLQNAALTSRRREEELKVAYAAQQERLLSMRDARVELAILSRDVENAQRTYDTALSRWLTNKVDSRAQLTNVALLSPAVAPLAPAQPKVGLIAGLSVLIGALLAAGMVYVLETLDRRVRSRSDLESRLAVPTLGRLSKWQAMGGRLLPAPLRAARALPHPW
jgi:chain length determinant protein EpsF